MPTSFSFLGDLDLVRIEFKGEVLNFLGEISSSDSERLAARISTKSPTFCHLASPFISKLKKYI